MIEQREIKFRGKRLDNNEWVYGDLLTGRNGKRFIVTSFILIRDKSGKQFIDEKTSDIYGVYPKTIGQYINLKDKYVKYIYEGDIIKQKNYGSGIGNLIAFYDYYVVIFEGISFQYKKINCSKKYSINPLSLNEKGSEIIGNIHDNPELLEEKIWHLLNR